MFVNRQKSSSALKVHMDDSPDAIHEKLFVWSAIFNIAEHRGRSCAAICVILA